VLAGLTGMKSSELLDALELLLRRGLVVNDSFMPVRFFMNRSAPKSPAQRARRVALAASRMEMGRWEIAWPVPERDLQQLLDRWLNRYGLLCRESLSTEAGSASWNEVYEALKVREYAGKVVRGYFVQGISGMQFMLPEAYQRLGSSPGMQVINACDPAQAYGRIIPHSASALPFTNVPGTVVVTFAGMPCVVFERFGEKVTFAGTAAQVTQAIQLFKVAFVEKRVWPGRRRVVVKYWPEDADEREILQTALAASGFRNVVQDMVLRR
jgi:ATP-dependent Lhr-like helicase